MVPRKEISKEPFSVSVTVISDFVDSYDYADLSGDSASVDAYQIKMEPNPGYNYTFKAEIIEGAGIGSLDTRELVPQDNTFRFVPKGRKYHEYNPDGTPKSGTYDVDYGAVTVRITCPELHFSEDYIINYGSASGRLVKAIKDPHTDSSLNKPWLQWDALSTAKNDYLVGLEAIVMYEGEHYPVTMVDFNKGTGNSGDSFRYYTDENWKNATMAWFIEDGNANWTASSTDSLTTTWYQPMEDGKPKVEFTPAEGEARPWLGGGIEFTCEGLNRVDPRIDSETNLDVINSMCVVTKADPVKAMNQQVQDNFGSICTIHAKEQGIYKLNYILIDMLTKVVEDPDTKEKIEVPIIVNGKPAYTTSKGSIPVYVISKTDQTLLASLFHLQNQALNDNTVKLNTSEIVVAKIREKVSKTNIDKWYLPERNPIIDNLYRGVSYMAFDEPHVYQTPNGQSLRYSGLKDLTISNHVDENGTAWLDFSKLMTAQKFNDVKSGYNSINEYSIGDITIEDASATDVTSAFNVDSNGLITTEAPVEDVMFQKKTFADFKLLGPTGI